MLKVVKVIGLDAGSHISGQSTLSNRSNIVHLGEGTGGHPIAKYHHFLRFGTDQLFFVSGQ
jgi:hypothetical protein